MSVPLRQPELLPGVSMPCMLAYAAAGNMLQFFAIIKRLVVNCTECHLCSHRINQETVAVDVPVTLSGYFLSAVPISIRHDLNTALGRIRAFNATCNIVRLLASYESKAPRLSVALGNVLETKSSMGQLLRTVTFFPGSAMYGLWRSRLLLDRPKTFCTFRIRAEARFLLCGAACRH